MTDTSPEHQKAKYLAFLIEPSYTSFYAYRLLFRLKHEILRTFGYKTDKHADLFYCQSNERVMENPSGTKTLIHLLNLNNPSL